MNILGQGTGQIIRMTFPLIIWTTLLYGQIAQNRATPANNQEESGESILAREKFFYTRRAGGPGKTIPENAYQEALAEHARLVKSQRGSRINGILPSWTSA